MTNTERETLCARIDELCAEVERLRQENQSIGMAAYELGRASLADENTKLRKLAARMARALGVGRWCSADCGREFGCDWTPEGCPAANAMRELGVDE